MTTYMAFDLGLARTGIAIGNSVTCTAQPLAVVAASGRKVLLEKLARVVDDWAPEEFIVGLPTQPDGAEHEMTRAARNFAKDLGKRFAKPVHLVDERYSSTAAGGRDDHAAALLLEQYLANR
ncbi:MAG: Holliday junction resolvase RuvX [Burkholderiaceae bacterium]